MNEEEKEKIELNIEAKYVDKTEKEFLSKVTYAECLYILTLKNKYCDKMKELSVLKLCEIIENLQKENKTLKNKLSLKQFDINVVYNDYLEKLNEYKKNSIQKQTIKEIIKELEDNTCRIKRQYSNGGENCDTSYLENLAQVKILKQILKESVK